MKLPNDGEIIPEVVRDKYDKIKLYLPALTAGYICDDRMEAHAREAIKNWEDKAIKEWEAKELSAQLLRSSRDEAQPPTQPDKLD